MIEIDTPSGLARAHLRPVDDPIGALILGHGAGGGIGARDLTAASEVALAAGYAVGLVEQPYRVAGRRSPAPARQLDAAWVAVVERLRGAELSGLPVIVGGRSSGARVACRTAAATGTAAVLCLAFPLHAPGRGGSGAPTGRAGGPGDGGRAASPSRQDELDEVQVPTLVVQGRADPFGIPAAGPGRIVVTLPGNHSLTSDLGGLAAAVRDWLAGLPVSAGRR